jgi:multicomponent Na+:H+ antiporter subunit D
MNAVVVAPILVPILTAAVLLMVRSRTAQRILSFGAIAISLASALTLVREVIIRDGAVVSRLGNWPGDVAITLVADRLAVAMVVISLVVLAAVLVFAIGQGSGDERSPFYYPAYLILAGGVSQAFLAGDLFNLFVAFELLLMASYVLLTLEGTREQIRSGTTYVVLNVVESLLLLFAVGLIFAATGTVNMAELPARLAELPDGVQLGLNLLLLVAFGIKAAVFPLFFWLPDSYPTSPSSVTAVFAGLLTKVGVYAMLRTETLLFPGGQMTLLIVVSGLTMIIGLLGAISHSHMKRILSFHIVSQIGYMVMGIAIATELAIAATIFYLIHQIPVKASLFLVEGIVEHETGSSSFDKVGGLVRRSGTLAFLFLVPALSLAGLPPFSGFLAKLSLVQAGFTAQQYVIISVALFGSLLTLISMIKIWTGVFWGEVEPAVPVERVGVLRHHRTMAAATWALVGVTIGVSVFGGWLFDFSMDAARDIVDPMIYVRAVMGS